MFVYTIEVLVVFAIAVVVLPIIFFIAKAEVDVRLEMVASMKERGMEYCLAELALANSEQRRSALKDAIRELQKRSGDYEAKGD